MSTRNHTQTKNAPRPEQENKTSELSASLKADALELALQARSRAEHEASFLKNEVERLHTSIVRLQERCEDYAMRLAMSHGGREELIHLRSRLFDTSHKLDIPKAHSEIVPNNVADQLRLLVSERDDARMWLDAVRRSTSWRITRPFRVVIRFLKSRLPN
ncbi:MULTISPECIES: hypothetical protein [Gluconobacter]|uniref:Uncharacterized protein n=1 Tax=Gluconobacter albidus TaxID=318683 RepID=A0AAW3QTF0_9PROT|nr:MULTISPECIES: hypothetical protein [Gluconobacter]KXV36914.1 hypothetical protein AD941_13665 [Gluconobacter albidus]MBS1028400.1 hypothetical protein [Gluconobacter albidus]MCP1274001.1 hypothetical protein [Gluconobacter albidus]OUI84749.1 hypothetical protein HK22_00730 [Gluconobacter sp. DsW_056]GLQ70036.1 hypothetical protein GCM10007866_24890 [Gluconobacter albidus]